MNSDDKWEMMYLLYWKRMAKHTVNREEVAKLNRFLTEEETEHPKRKSRPVKRESI